MLRPRSVYTHKSFTKHVEVQEEKRVSFGYLLLASFVTGVLVLSSVAYMTLGRVIAAPLDSQVGAFAPAQDLGVGEEQNASPKVIKQVASTDSEVVKWVQLQEDSSWSVYVREVGEDKPIVDFRSDVVVPIASIYKLFLLKPLLAQQAFDTWSSRSIAGKSYEACVDLMLRVSDNACAEAIGARVGWSSIDRQLSAAGYKDTSFTKDPRALGTAYESALMLEELSSTFDRNSGVGSLIFSALDSAKTHEGIRGGCVECQRVTNKTGNFNETLHDAAIIEKNGRSYIIVVMSEYGSWQQISELTELVTARL